MADFKPPIYRPDEDTGPPPSADLSDRFPEDARLRRAGFRIERRPRHGPNIWSYHGVEFRECEALDYQHGEPPVIFDPAIGRYRRKGQAA